ncbi:alpha/beta hydrolase family protein [Ectobacillus antri]|uniref:alpha/beta hydrolase family protein n=1 Tax=Ectobacillus antri TaxID=2486280 RepID=UPI000F5ACA70|nr:prolyl oligopeptidase family serine peptidase [Ectobacillus antri]
MIYHITYISNNLRVKGYLGLPPGFIYSFEELQQHITNLYQDTLPITPLTNDLPINKPFGPFPALLYCRGGIGKIGKVKVEWIEQFTQHGYVVFAPSYRGNEGGEGRDEFGGAENEDVLAAYYFLQSLPFTTTISIMGFSRGAINAVQTTVQLHDVHKLILWGGVSNLAQTYEERIDLRRMLKRVLNGSPNKIPQAYKHRSPIYMTEHIQCPVLIMHGTEDVQVDLHHGMDMYHSLLEKQHPVELHLYEGYGHHLTPLVHQQALIRMFEWLEQ